MTTAKDDLISRRGVVERLRKVAHAWGNSNVASVANALADELAAEDSVEMWKTTSGHSPVVDQSHLQLSADRAAIERAIGNYVLRNRGHVYIWLTANAIFLTDIHAANIQQLTDAIMDHARQMATSVTQDRSLHTLLVEIAGMK